MWQLQTEKTHFDVLSLFSLSWEISMLVLSCSVCRELFNSYNRKKKYTNRRNTFKKIIVIHQKTKIKKQVIIFYHIKIKWKHNIKNWN